MSEYFFPTRNQQIQHEYWKAWDEFWASYNWHGNGD